MKEAKKLILLYRLSVILLFFIMITACERNEYELLDPSSAGAWTLYSTATGLPGNGIGDVERDSKNNLWVTFSGKGAASYSNDKWTTYTTSNSSILSNYVTCIAETSSSSIIFGTTNGISIKTATGQWSSYRDPLATMNVKTIKASSKGWIWIGTKGQGFYLNDGSGYENVYVASFSNVNAIEEDASGNIYLGTDNGLLKWNGNTWSLITTSDGLPAMKVTALFYDSKKRLWIGTSGGETVSWLDSSGKMSQLFLMNGTIGTFIMDIYEDRKGDMWFATWFDGLIYYDWVIPVSYKKFNGFFEDDVNSIGEDKDGNLWFGLYSKGLVKYSLPLD